MASPPPTKSVLFVCLGNICRSTMAEGLLRHLVQQRSDTDEWKIDSCGTARYHIGASPNVDTMKTLKKHNINDYKHAARQLSKSDFTDFRWIFVMDQDNYSDVMHTKPKNGGDESKVMLLREFDPEKNEARPIVIDPSFEDDKKYFEICYEQCMRSLKSFLDKEF